MQFKIQPERNLGLLPKIKEGKLADGEKGNLQTVELMRQVARDRAQNPVIRRLALNILNFYSVPSHAYIQEALAVGDYVKNKVAYVRDPDGIEYLQDPVDLVNQIISDQARGDCDDQALLIATLLIAIGHTPYFRCVRYSGVFGNFNHIYVVDYEKDLGGPKRRVVLDAIVKNQPIGYEVSHASGQDIAV